MSRGDFLMKFCNISFDWYADYSRDLKLSNISFLTSWGSPVFKSSSSSTIFVYCYIFKLYRNFFITSASSCFLRICLSSIWLRNHSCFLLEMMSAISSQLRGAPSSSSSIKLSFSYPKSGLTSILVIWSSMCCNSARRRGFEAIFILGFLTRKTSLPFGLRSSTVVSLGLNLMWLFSFLVFVLCLLYYSISGKKPDATVLFKFVLFILSSSICTPAAFQAASFLSFFSFAILASILAFFRASFCWNARIVWKLDC